jgi:hypothetical protein
LSSLAAAHGIVFHGPPLGPEEAQSPGVDG